MLELKILLQCLFGLGDGMNLFTGLPLSSIRGTDEMKWGGWRVCSLPSSGSPGEQHFSG